MSNICLVVKRKLKIKKQSEDKIIKKLRHSFKLKKENEPINGRIIREIKTIFEQEEDYHKLTRIDNFWTNNYIEYESNSDRNKNPINQRMPWCN